MYKDGGCFSIDRLLEFGMSMAIAQQIVKTISDSIDMNRTVQTTKTYYVVIDGKKAGPFSDTEIVRLINDKKMSKESYVWYQGLTTWKIAENVPEILKLVALTPL